MNKNYTDINAKIIDKWVDEGWVWGRPISKEVFARLNEMIGRFC